MPKTPIAKAKAPVKAAPKAVIKPTAKPKPAPAKATKAKPAPPPPAPARPYRITAKALSNALLQPAIDKCTERGIKTEIATLMTEITGSRVTRQTVERWLLPDPEKRDHPSLGNGLILLAVFRAHQDGLRSAETIREIVMDIKTEIHKRD